VRKVIPLLIVLAALVFAATASARLIVGTRGDDTLTGTDKRDHILAKAGNDTITGKGGSDVALGQAGNDTISGDEGPDLLFGGPGNDALDGGVGNDQIWTGWGTDTVDAGDGDDIVHSAADDSASDIIDCGPGFDRAFIRTGDVAVNCERVRSVVGHHPVPGSIQKGTRGDDTMTGTAGRDIILALAGNDTVSGGDGNDFLFGMFGNDTLNGDAGNDQAWGGPGNDTVNGGDGNDWLHAGWGADTVNGGAGDDHIWTAANDGMADAVDCGDGTDRAVIRPGDTAVNCEVVKTIS
jgi:Ca2+-binding RTX toxin-like protein